MQRLAALSALLGLIVIGLVVPDLASAQIVKSSYGSTTRLVSGTGAPSTGTWRKGEIVMDDAGDLFKCTVAGSPGTWAAVGGGGNQGVDGSLTVTVTDSDTAATAGNDVFIVLRGADVVLCSNNSGTSANGYFEITGNNGAGDPVSDYVHVIHDTDCAAGQASRGTVAQVYVDEDSGTSIFLVDALATSDYPQNYYIETLAGRLIWFNAVPLPVPLIFGVALQFDDDGVDPETDRLLFVSPTNADVTAATEATRSAHFTTW